VDPSTVRRWEAGGRPTPSIVSSLAKALGLSLAELDRLLHPEEMPRHRITAPTAMHRELLSQYEMLTNVCRQVDYQAGSPAVYAETRALVAHLMELSDSVPSALYQRFALAVGDAAQLAAWLAIDREEHAAARQYGALALAHAQEAGDPALHAYVLGVMSYLHLHAGRGTEALRLLSTALRHAEGPHSGVGAVVRSWLSEAQAEAYAISGQPEAGARALAKAERLFDAVSPDEVPTWLSFFNSAEHLNRRKGRCLVLLGDAGAATVALAEAARELPAQYVRERSGVLIDVAVARLLPHRPGQGTAGDPEAAAAVALDAWTLAVRTGSGRNQRRIRDLVPRFGPHRELGSVRTLLEAVT
jgi:hypothetical protein